MHFRVEEVIDLLQSALDAAEIQEVEVDMELELEQLLPELAPAHVVLKKAIQPHEILIYTDYKYGRGARLLIIPTEGVQKISRKTSVEKVRSTKFGRKV